MFQNNSLCAYARLRLIATVCKAFTQYRVAVLTELSDDFPIYPFTGGGFFLAKEDLGGCLTVHFPLALFFFF